MVSFRNIRFEYQIAPQQKGERKAGAIGEGRLNIEGTVNQPVAHLREPVAGAAANGLSQIVLTLARSGFGPYAEERGHQCGFEQLAPVVVYLIRQTGLADRVSTRQLLQHEALAVREDQPGPDDLGALLPEGDAAVIRAKQRTACGIRR